MSILWTIVPPEEVWEEEPGSGGTFALMEATLEGVPLLARPTPQGAVIERLLTTDPYAYLRPDLAPGTVITSHSQA